jgi:alpha-ketoglutarate-dependent taurine dioxygenase
MKLAIRPIQGEFCAEVIGADLARPMDDTTFAEIQRAWTRHSILVFRDLRMSPEQHIALTRRFGPLHIMEPLQYNLAGHPEIFVVSNVEDGGKALGMKRAGWGWHSDGEDKEIPNAGSFLHSIELPPEGGDTLFADMYGALEGLDASTRKTIIGRRACFSRVRLHHVHYPHLPALTAEDKRKKPDVWHPMARKHPKSGWTALYVGRWACEVEGMPEAEGAELIRSLQEFSVRPQFVYRHRWRPGDAVLWDNRCAQHCATPFDDEKYRRHMHRTTIEGEVPLMATSPAFRSSSLATQ